MADVVSDAVVRMTRFYEETSGVRRHDIDHFMKVWAFARTIGMAEGLAPDVQETLELAAVAHDIACPLCREKYGSADGKAQEQEGGPLTRSFYQDAPIPDAERDRVCFLVAHHHTYRGVDGPDWQILLEADFLVNADEKDLPREAVRRFRDNVFRTKTGTELLDAMYLR